MPNRRRHARCRYVHELALAMQSIPAQGAAFRARSDTGAIAMCPDGGSISAESSAGHDIAEYERQFREILEHCPAGLNVVDEDGRLLFHNSRIRELFGYTEEELHLFDT